MFASWSQLLRACPACGFVFERESGYWVGAIIVNTAVAETLFALAFIPSLIVTWPDVAWQPVAVAAVVTNGLLPWWFYPRSKTTWLGLDLYFNPRRAEDFR